VMIEYLTADGHFERLPALAADLVRRRPAAMIAIGGLAALAAKAATRDIPIIFTSGTGPIELDLVASLNRPGGNVTGVANLSAEIAEKRLELLHKAVPAAETIALLVGQADSPLAQAEAKYMQSAARTLGLRLLEHFSIRLGVARVCEISFAFVFGNPFEKRGDCFPKLLNSARLHFA